jgi:hypothetical protein
VSVTGKWLSTRSSRPGRSASQAVRVLASFIDCSRSSIRQRARLGNGSVLLSFSGQRFFAAGHSKPGQHTKSVASLLQPLFRPRYSSPVRGPCRTGKKTCTNSRRASTFASPNCATWGRDAKTEMAAVHVRSCAVGFAGTRRIETCRGPDRYQREGLDR